MLIKVASSLCAHSEADDKNKSRASIARTLYMCVSIVVITDYNYSWCNWTSKRRPYLYANIQK